MNSFDSFTFKVNVLSVIVTNESVRTKFSNFFSPVFVTVTL